MKLSFSSEKTRLLDRLRETNNQLHLFLDRDERIYKPPLIQSPSFPLERLCNRAIGLHEDLSSCCNFPCTCITAHNVAITVKPIRSTGGKYSGQACVDALLRNDTRKALFHVELLEDHGVVTQSNEPLQKNSSTAHFGRVPKLAAQIRQREREQLAAETDKERRLATLAVSSSSISAQPLPSLMVSPRSKFGKRTHELMSSIGVRRKRALPMHTTEDLNDRRVSVKVQDG